MLLDLVPGELFSKVVRKPNGKRLERVWVVRKLKSTYR